jgi:signal transduction histidine kinase
MTNAGGDTANDLQQQVEILRAQLAQAQKSTALGELLGTTTHEFNNVLMTILNYAQMGLRTQDEATRTKALEKVLAAGQRAAKITNSILGMARNRSTGLEPTDLASLTEDCLILLERELRKYRVAVERDFQAAPPALANGNQIQQVLLNLLINARQAMPDGGTILLRLRHDAERQMVVLTVRDSGKGIAAEDLRKIFEPYFSTKSGPDETGKGGTGLGLATCRDIIERHRGRMRVESTPGKGSAFTLLLPVAPPPAPPTLTGDTPVPDYTPTA